MKINTVKFLIAIFLMFSLFVSCNELDLKVKSRTTSTAELMQMDKEFSDMCQRVGMRKAFLHYISDEGVLLRPGFTPIVGADAVEYLSQVNDTDYSISWKPMQGVISSSGDLGYTYGIYQISMEDTTVKGTYVNIWQMKNGQWKFVLESGNQGISGEP